MERIEFLAEGALTLSRKGIVPGTMEELKAGLKEIDFEHTITSRGEEVTLKASDDANYEIPADDLSGEGVGFVIEKPKLGVLNRRREREETQHATPCSIRTDKLKPKSMTVKWTRDRKTLEFSYRVILK